MIRAGGFSMTGPPCCFWCLGGRFSRNVPAGSAGASAAVRLCCPRVSLRGCVAGLNRSPLVRRAGDRDGREDPAAGTRRQEASRGGTAEQAAGKEPEPRQRPSKYPACRRRRRSAQGCGVRVGLLPPAASAPRRKAALTNPSPGPQPLGFCRSCSSVWQLKDRTRLKLSRAWW